MKLTLALLVLCFSSVVHAAAPAEKADFARSYLRAYLSKSALKGSELASLRHPPNNCDPDFQDDPNCVQIACNLGSLRCSTFSSDLDKAAQLCQGVSGQCLQDTCAYGSYRCGTFSSDLEKVAQLCHGIRPRCVKAVCDQGSLRCGTFSSDLDKAAQLCQGGARASCITQMCSMGSYKCGTFSSDLEKVVQLCNGQ